MDRDQTAGASSSGSDHCDSPQPSLEETAASGMQEASPRLGDEDSAPSVLPDFSGYLEKHSPTLFVGWQRRFFRLHDKKLSYYKREKDPHARGVICFDQSSVDVKIVTSSTPKELHLVPVAGSRTFRLRATSDDELTSWSSMLYLHIAASRGYAEKMTSVAVQKQFWRYDRISEKDFSQNVATTCDLLLFRGKGLSAKLQRAVTRSEFDHVALMLRYASGKLAFLEATALDGVTIIEWDEFLYYKWHLLYSRLIFRKLEMQRSDDLLQRLEVFIQEVRGKKYKITASKLLRRAGNKRPGSEEGFFCSELVASAYKHVGLLPPQTPASNYLPGDFAREKRLDLLGGARFEADYLIDFSLA